jgi:hypothetical protein
MRLMSLATLIVLGLCLAYARHVDPAAPQTASYRGPATFVGLSSLGEEGAAGAAYWLLVCRVDGQRVAFPANDEWVRRAAAPLHPGQPVTVSYDLPVKSLGDNYTEFGPPTLRGIAPANGGAATGGDALALNTGSH